MCVDTQFLMKRFKVGGSTSLCKMKVETVELQKESLAQFKTEAVDVFVVSTSFDPANKYYYPMSSNDCFSQESERTNTTLHQCFKSLKSGGLLFVYGLPRYLPQYAVFLDSLKESDSEMIFKYWVAMEVDRKNRKETLPPVHMGLLMYLKSRKGKTSSPFHLNTKTVRIPYKMCKACGRNIRDWGGKKHLRNPHGAAISDVWRDLPKIWLEDNVIPSNVLERIYRLVERPGMRFFHIVETHPGYRRKLLTEGVQAPSRERSTSHDSGIDVVLRENSLEYMQRVLEHHPNGIFDLAFADPPYNLEKGYAHYKDLKSDQKYIEWSYQWLDLMSKVVRPGGALLVLNLPKYCTHYAHFLSQRMNFRHWIAWDAMSTPAGKIMPAHYALLYYTRPGGPITFNYLAESQSDANILSPLDADHYCLHASCVKKRKLLGDRDKVELNDIWWNIHRIKHRKYRDQHPCQLPTKLMQRIIRMTTDEGNLILDPFCGAGTTAIAAKMTRRHFVVIDIDEKYVNIAEKNLRNMQMTATGDYWLPRKRNKYPRTKITKREVEIEYIQLCKEKLRIVELEEVALIDPRLYTKVIRFYKDLKTLRKVAHRRLEIQGLI